jgi:GMP synthase (glutamine-hydrolysing)
MKKILILKTGTTFDSIRRNYGDFEDFIVSAAGITRSDIRVIAVYQEKLPAVRKIFSDISSVIITGSHSMVTDGHGWIESLCCWIREFADTGFPVLGICYGHQLLAMAWGGIVEFHPSGGETGTVWIKLTDEGLNDSLLGIFPVNFIAHVSHAQSVTRLPANARVLAYNDFEPHHSFRIDNNVWGVQFHPEFNKGIMKGYIMEQREIIESEGYNTESLLSSVKEHKFGIKLLCRFVEISFGLKTLL